MPLDLRTRNSRASIANPLRIPGLARIVAGGWFIASGAATLRHPNDLVMQAQRLFGGDPGSTDAPLRSLLSLVLAVALVPIGAVLIAKGLRAMRRLPLPPEGPAALTRDEVFATLVGREPPAFGDGPIAPYWPLRRWLKDQLPDLTWWRRDLMGRGARAFVRSSTFAFVLGVLYITLPYLTASDLLGPFPTSFVFLLLIVTGGWAVLGLMLIPSHGPRIESFEFTPLSRGTSDGTSVRGPVSESSPLLLDRESPGLGVTLGILGVAVQWLMVPWWTLSTIGYPLMTTSIVRHAASIAGGIVFLVLGERMLRAAAEMLLCFRYASTLALVEENGQAMVGHGALVRTEGRGLNGPRHVVAAVAGPDAREKVQSLMAGDG